MPTVIVPDITVTLEHLRCAACGLHFAVDEQWVSKRREDHKGFNCPNGCGIAFNGKTKAEKEAEKLKKMLESEQSYATSLHERLQQERTQHSATKGQLTKTRNRVSAALCPVDGCGRSFKQLRQHLTRMHPDFVAPGVVEKHSH